MNGISVGVQKCRCDDDLTLLAVNQQFYDMFGYTKQDIEGKFDNKLMSIIYEDDKIRIKNIQLNTPNIEIEYRVWCSDGTYKWILNRGVVVDEDSAKVSYCVLIDVTDEKKMEHDLKMSLGRHSIIMDQTKDIIFEWDVATDSILYSSNFKKKFGYEPITTEISHSVEVKNHIHPDDFPIFMELWKRAKFGQEYTTSEIRIITIDGDYIWCLIRATVQFDEQGKPVKAIGVIIDITTEKLLIEELRDRAERDALTGLYNRKEAMSKIKNYLQYRAVDQQCALMMVDMDNFKAINDTKGHLFGDAVLAEISNAMKASKNSNEIIARIGGDEFAVFIKDIQSQQTVIDKAQNILEIFRKTVSRTNNVIEVTCSIGIAISPEHGQTFYELYASADQALYNAKNNGKDGFEIFDGNIGDKFWGGDKSSLGSVIDSDKDATSNDFAQYVFEILYQHDNLYESINLILEIVGKRFDVSRAYIFENTADNMYTCNTFEWCNKNVSPQIDVLAKVPFEEIGNYELLFNEQGIFYCQDITTLPIGPYNILAPQGIRSILQCAIREKGKWCGFVGFDECTGNRFWTQDEIVTLTLIAKVLTTFLLKQRAQDEDRKSNEKLRQILDTQDAFIYVVEDKTFELLYLNEKTKLLDKTAEPGSFCYKSFFGYDSQCQQCPIRNIKSGKLGQYEFYNPQYNMWTSASASPLTWDDTEAYLVFCYDITKYKKK